MSFWVYAPLHMGWLSLCIDPRKEKAVGSKSIISIQTMLSLPEVEGLVLPQGEGLVLYSFEMISDQLKQSALFIPLEF